jgi:hypothetical protein
MDTIPRSPVLRYWFLQRLVLGDSIRPRAGAEAPMFGACCPNGQPQGQA